MRVQARSHGDWANDNDQKVISGASEDNLDGSRCGRDEINARDWDVGKERRMKLRKRSPAGGREAPSRVRNQTAGTGIRTPVDAQH